MTTNKAEIVTIGTVSPDGIASGWHFRGGPAPVNGMEGGKLVTVSGYTIGELAALCGVDAPEQTHFSLVTNCFFEAAEVATCVAAPKEPNP